MNIEQVLIIVLSITNLVILGLFFHYIDFAKRHVKALEKDIEFLKKEAGYK